MIQMNIGGHPLQWTAFVGFFLLALVCVWAARARPMLRPWAWGILVWALNNTAFYVYFLFILGGISNSLIIPWSAVIRLHGIFLAAGALIVATGKRAIDE